MKKSLNAVKSLFMVTVCVTRQQPSLPLHDVLIYPVTCILFYYTLKRMYYSSQQHQQKEYMATWLHFSTWLFH